MKFILLIASILSVSFPELIESAAVPPKIYSWQTEMMNLINGARAQAGLGKLCLNSKLNNDAINYAMLLQKTNSFTHEDGSTPKDRIVQAGFQPGYYAENLAGPDAAQPAFTALMNSPPHRQNILDPNVQFLGIGGSSMSEQHTGNWVQVFASSSTESCANVPESSGAAAAPATQPAQASANTQSYPAIQPAQNSVNTQSYPATQPAQNSVNTQSNPATQPAQNSGSSQNLNGQRQIQTSNAPATSGVSNTSPPSKISYEQTQPEEIQTYSPPSNDKADSTQLIEDGQVVNNFSLKKVQTQEGLQVCKQNDSDPSVRICSINYE